MYRNTLAGLVAAAAVALGATTVSAQTVTLRYSNWLPPGLFLWKDILLPWTAEVEKVTEGRVKMEILPKVVGTATSQFDVIRDGLADVAYINASYTPGRFVSTELAELPLGGENSAVMSAAFDRFYRKELARYNEFKGVELVSIFTISPIQTFTARKQIKTIDDFKGVKLRSPNNTTTDVMNRLGAVPIHKSATEAFEMLSTGAIDGQMTIPNTIPGFNQLNLLKYVTLIPGGLANSINMVGINQAKWNAISEADRKAILAISTEKLARAVGAGYTKADNEAFEIMQKAGYVIEKASADFVAKARELLAPVAGGWAQRAKDKGIETPEKLMADFHATIEAVAKE
jgi:TRAP-type C4-dicarboxylate transport system substrate-binding protein